MDWKRGSPGGAGPWSSQAGTGELKAKPQSLLEGRRLRVTTARSGASEKIYYYDKKARQSNFFWIGLEKVLRLVVGSNCDLLRGCESLLFCWKY
jgi:hypothetical protein